MDTDGGVDQIAAERAHPGKRPLLVAAGELAVSDYVCSEDCCQLPGFCHGCPSPHARLAHLPFGLDSLFWPDHRCVRAKLLDRKVVPSLEVGLRPALNTLRNVDGKRRAAVPQGTNPPWTRAFANLLVSSLIRLLPNVRQPALTSFSMMSIMTFALRPFRLCAQAVSSFAALGQR
jgi:hypothetical protein